MKTINWCEKNAIVCRVESMWGVDISSGQFNMDMDSHGRSQWGYFCSRVKTVFPLEDVDIVVGVLNDSMILFKTEEEARKLYNIMCESPFEDVYACLISPDAGLITENT